MLRLTTIALLGALMLGAPAATTRAAGDHDRARAGVQSGQLVPLGRVLSDVRGRYGGRVIDARLSQGRGQPLYVIKVLTPDGRVREVVANARDGRIVGAR